MFQLKAGFSPSFILNVSLLRIHMRQVLLAIMNGGVFFNSCVEGLSVLRLAVHL